MKISLFILCLFTTYTYADISNQQLAGQWKVTKYLADQYGADQLSSEQSNSIAGKTLAISDQNISLKTSLLFSDDRTCTVNTATSGWVISNPIKFFNNNYEPLAKLFSK